MSKILVTGSAGHLGEALVRTLSEAGETVIGLDVKPSDFTHFVGSITDPAFVQRCFDGVTAVMHTATLHKPHVATHSRQAFVDTNISGTLNLLEEAAKIGVQAFVFTSTTSAFGDAMQAGTGESAVWVNEALQPRHKNIYGVTKTAAESLCELFAHKHDVPCIVLRTSRFFPEEDDARVQRESFSDDNLKLNELLFRRADIQDMVDAHIAAMHKAKALMHDLFVISASPPFVPGDMTELATDAPTVVERYFPHYADIYRQHGWKMFTSIGRVYDNARAIEKLGWAPRYTFGFALDCVARGESFKSPLARLVGSKGYHDIQFQDGPYPVDS